MEIVSLISKVQLGCANAVARSSDSSGSHGFEAALHEIEQEEKIIETEQNRDGEVNSDIDSVLAEPGAEESQEKSGEAQVDLAPDDAVLQVDPGDGTANLVAADKSGVVNQTWPGWNQPIMETVGSGRTGLVDRSSAGSVDETAETNTAAVKYPGNARFSGPDAGSMPNGEDSFPVSADLAKIAMPDVVDGLISSETAAILARADAVQASAPAAAATTYFPAVRQVADAVATLAQQPEKPLEIALNPEELGRVRMSFSPIENGVVVMISAERAETLDLMRRHLDLLAEEFRRAGYQEIGFRFDDGSGQRDRTGAQQNHRYNPPSELEIHQMTLPRNRPVTTGLDLRL